MLSHPRARTPRRSRARELACPGVDAIGQESKLRAGSRHSENFTPAGRQFGADHVQLDTREQRARAHLFEPQTLDFEEFLNAAESANFPTTELSIELAAFIDRA